MNEGIRNLTLLVWALCAMNSNSYASDKEMFIQEESVAEAPTMVYGSSRKSENERDSVLVEQPDGAPNPLGNPMYVPDDSTMPEVETAPEVQSSPSQADIMQKPAEGNVSTEKLGQKFQNTLMEANGMVYDVQAYPVEDLKAIGNPSNPQTIYSPNVNP